jgi:hypothetical protein
MFLSNAAVAAPPEVPASKQPAMSREEQRQFDAWRKSMARIPLPKKGCFTASYPGKEWHEVPCIAAPPPRPYTVGSAVDFSAVVSGAAAAAAAPELTLLQTAVIAARRRQASRRGRQRSIPCGAR